MISYLSRLILVSALFICSFGEVSTLSNISSRSNFFPITIRINQAYAGFDYSNCKSELDVETCNEIRPL